MKKLIAASGAVFAMLAAPLAVDHFVGGVFSSAMADSHQGNKGAGGGGGAGKGAGGQKGAGKGGKGGSIEDRVFRAEPDDDSDRPDWAGVKGGKAGGGTKPPGAGTKKGDLFGDMVVLLRDDLGQPILNSAGLVQVIAFVYDEEGNVVPLTDAEGSLQVIPYNSEGDLLTQMVVDGQTYSVVPAEVDLGRLSVGRSPSKVLDKALTDALSKLIGIAEVTLDSTGRLVVAGVTIDSPLENLALYETYLTTGTLPDVDMTNLANLDPAALFAAAADKTGSIIVDTVVYMNAILGIDTTTTTTYFSTYDYDRSTTWETKTAVVLVLQDDGTYAEDTVNLYDAVFNNTDWTSTASGADAFAQAADDYLQVLEFVHDNAVR